MRLAKTLTRVVMIATMFCVTQITAKEPRVQGARLEFTLPNLAGVTVASDSLFRDKVVYVTLWGTWCPPCVSEIPTLNKLHEKYTDDGLVVAAIAFEREQEGDARRQRLRAFSKKHDIKYLILDGGTTSDFSKTLPMIENAKGLPIEILIDGAGTVVACRNSYGYSELWSRKVDLELQKLLENKQTK